MRSFRLAGVLATTLSLTACLNSTTLVKVKPDGSGTVEQTTLVNMAAIKGAMGGGDKTAPQGPMMNKADLERMAESMGKGVRLVSAEPAKGEMGFEGTKAIFAFDDINEIQITNGPPNMSGSTSGRVRSAQPTQDDPVRFKLTRSGGTSTLTINYIDNPGGDKPAAQPGQPNPAGGGDMPDLTNPMIMNMMKTMLAGMRINIGLQVMGSIVKTNAEYVSGSNITLLDLDVAALLADEANLKALQGKVGPGASLSEVKPYLKDIKGIKVDGPSINVQFR
jgi:hypothetical protein